MRVELDKSTCAMNPAPIYPRELEVNFNLVREELDKSAFPMDAAPVYLI